VNIKEIHENWTALGQDDPMWVVLTDPQKKGGGWQAEEFFATGRAEITGVLEKIKQSGLALKFDRALDFGCGLGRLSQALGESFAKVDAVDVSASMIEQAQSFNKLPAKVFYHLNVRTDLDAFAAASYDFAYSNICLQHIPTQFQTAYIAGFMRLLKPGGVAYFQTIHAHGWRQLVPDFAVDFYRKLKSQGKPFIPMHAVPVELVRAAVKSGGGTIRKRTASAYGGHESRFVVDVYIVTKAA
jgi:2-polyprenyl-3-methyl-5-hydroxy-6-metoxy-1,4-benzoquinol methylase